MGAVFMMTKCNERWKGMLWDVMQVGMRDGADESRCRKGTYGHVFFRASLEDDSYVRRGLRVQGTLQQVQVDLELMNLFGGSNIARQRYCRVVLWKVTTFDA